MAEDWAANVKKYVPDADDGIIAGIVRYCGIALQKRDSSLVSFGDPKETDRVRENYLKKKLGLTHSDEKLDAAIADVGTRMKGENFKNRVTVYYLLAEQFGLLGMFSKTGKAPAASAAPVKAAAATAAVAGLASLGANDSDADDKGSGVGAAVAAGAAGAAALGAAAVAAAPSVTPTIAAAAQPLSSSTVSDSDEGGSSWGWLLWLLLAALVLGVLWWLFRGKDAATNDSGVTTEQAATASEAAVPASEAAPAAPPPAEGTVAIPTGAGVTTESRDGKPVVKVYFDTGKAEVVPAFTPAAGGLKAWLDSHSGSTLAVSGYNDKTGNAAKNAELSKNRAIAVKAALVASGIPDASVLLVKPEASTDTSTDNAGARRVEVVVQ